MTPELLQETIATLLQKIDVVAENIAVTTGHRTVVAVSSLADGQRLIGPNGDNLRALNTIARRLVEASHGEDASNFHVDVNGYHEAEVEKIRAGARVLAQRARLFKHDVEMEPMSPYDRLVIHELFSGDPEIKTRSEGEGKFRHIVLSYAG